MDEWQSKPSESYTEIFKYLKQLYRELRIKIKFPLTISEIQQVFKNYITEEYKSKMYEECPELQSLGHKNVNRLLLHHVLNPLSTKNFLTLQQKVEQIVSRFLAQLDFLTEIDEEQAKEYIASYIEKNDEVLLAFVRTLPKNYEPYEDVTYSTLNGKLNQILSITDYAQKALYKKYGSWDYYTKQLEAMKEKTIQLIFAELEICHSRILRQVEKILKRGIELAHRDYKDVFEHQLVEMYVRNPRVNNYVKSYNFILNNLLELMKSHAFQELGEVPNDVFMFQPIREIKEMLDKSIIVDRLFKNVLQDPITFQNTIYLGLREILDDLFITGSIPDIFDTTMLGGKEKVFSVFKIILLTDYVEFHKFRYGIYFEIVWRVYQKHISKVTENESSLMQIVKMIHPQDNYTHYREILQTMLTKEIEIWSTMASDWQNLYALISIFVAFNAVPAENMSTRYTNHLRCMLKCVFRNFQNGHLRFTNFQILCALESLILDYKAPMKSRQLRRMDTTELQKETLERIRTTNITSYKQQSEYLEQLASLEAQINANITKPNKFILEKISDPKVKSKSIIICISGFTSEDTTKSAEWRGIPTAFPNSEVIALHWRSSTINALFEAVVKEASEITNAKEGLIFGFALPSLKTLTLGFMAYKAIKALSDDQWGATYKEAITTGIYLAHILAETDLFKDYVINFMAFSLGTLVVMNCIWELERMDRHDIIYDVVLMGGVVNVGDFNEGTMSIIGHKLINCYCANDFILKYILKVANFGTNPIGLGPILTPNKKVENLDVTKMVNGHTRYRENLYNIIAEIDFNEDFRYMLEEQQPVNS